MVEHGIKYILLLAICSYISFGNSSCNFKGANELSLDSIKRTVPQILPLDLCPKEDSTVIGTWYQQGKRGSYIYLFYTKENKYFRTHIYEDYYCCMTNGKIDSSFRSRKKANDFKFFFGRERFFINKQIASVDTINKAFVLLKLDSGFHRMEILANENDRLLDRYYWNKTRKKIDTSTNIYTRIPSLEYYYQSQEKYLNECKRLDSGVIAIYDYHNLPGVYKLYQKGDRYFDDCYTEDKIVAHTKLMKTVLPDGNFRFDYTKDDTRYGVEQLTYYPRDSKLTLTSKIDKDVDTMTIFKNWPYDYSKMDSAVYYGTYDYWVQEYMTRKR